MRIENFWPTPILFDEITDKDLLNSAVSYLYMNKHNLVGTENQDKSILELPELKELKERIFIPAFNKFLEETCNKSIDEWSYRLNGWLVSYSEGQSLNHHNHRGSQLSSVLYLVAEEDAVGGEIFFTDPRQNANRGYDSSFQHLFKPLKMKPKVGQLVVFPSFLYHYVTTYQSNIRMAIPVDCFLYNSNK